MPFVVELGDDGHNVKVNDFYDDVHNVKVDDFVLVKFAANKTLCCYRRLWKLIPQKTKLPPNL